MKTHIGQKVRQRAKELRIGPTELGKLINTSRSNIYSLYARRHIDVEMLMKLSYILKFNFFTIYQEEVVLPEETNIPGPSSEKPTKLYMLPEEIIRLNQAVAELTEKYNVLVKSLEKKEKKK